MSDFEAIVQAYEAAGGDPQFLKSPRVASLVISGNQVLGVNEIPGLHMTAEQLPDGVSARIVVDENTEIEMPVHLCFGVVPAEGVQRIVSDFEIGAGASVEFLAHCTFPNALKIEHIMQGTVTVGAGATLRYKETHYHGQDGGIRVLPTARITVAEGGRYFSEFNQTKGRAGYIAFDYEIDVAANGVAEISAKAMGSADDHITVSETIRLNGENARGLAKSRIAVRDRARSDVISKTEGNAPYVKGHVDCVEIVRDAAVATAIPQVSVSNPLAQITHEAAIGTVDKKELETLMARGLGEEAAVDVIVRGMLAD